MNRSTVILWFLAFLALAAVAVGMGRALSHPIRPPAEVRIDPAPAPVDVNLVSTLLDINERAAGLAGYPALVEANRRRDTAGQAATRIGELALEIEEIADPYAVRQTEILKDLQSSLETYAWGKGTARLGVASAANAELRGEMAGLLEWAALEIQRGSD
jgi:hypothetical protein